MKKQCFINLNIAGVSLTDFGLKIPSPFVSLQVENTTVDTYSNWSLSIVVGGDASRGVNVAAFESLIYSASQAADGYSNSSGIPVSFAFGWLDDKGNVAEYTTYRGWSIKFQVSTQGQFMSYVLTGYASLAVQMNSPVINIPATSGIYQPSAGVEGILKGIKADYYYDLDIDHCDTPTLIQHGAMTTSVTSYIRGSRTSREDNYDDFAGMLRYSKCYNSCRDAVGIKNGMPLRTLMNNLTVTPIRSYLKAGLTDDTVQSSSFSYWVEEPTMTRKGVIHYKSNAGLMKSYNGDTLEYGTSNTNVISIDGSYNGVAYNMTDMSFASLGFDVDGSGNTILKDATVTNSWSSSLAQTFATAGIINDINALATQFSGEFTVTVPGTIKQYKLAQPISLVVMNGNTTSPVSGIYNIMSVSHAIKNTFITTLKLQRLTMSSANQVAMSQGIYVVNGTTGGYTSSSYRTTPNVKSPYKVDYGNTIYPDMPQMVANSPIMAKM